MAISAFPYTAVLDVSANTLLGNNTGSPAAAIALTATQVRTLLSIYTSAQVDSLLAGYQPLDADLTAIAALTTTSFGRSLLTQADAAATRTTIGAGTSSFSGAYGDLTGIPATFTPSSHAHGNITNAGAIGTTASLPVITGASGVLTAGAFGTTSGTFCQGDDSRLSDSRTPTAHKTSHATGGSDALTAADIGAVPTSLTLTINGTTQDLSANRTFTISAGVSGSTGSVDNAMLRADGTGGSTLQASGWLMADNYTTSPNNTVNHASLQATGGTTNVSVSIVPKGSGSFSLHVPDGTSTGGNARGANAVDLQISRSLATQIASGTGAAIIGGRNNTASGDYAIAGGSGCTSSGLNPGPALGINNTASGGNGAAAIGGELVVTGNYGFASGYYGLSSGGERIHSRDAFNLRGGQQIVDIPLWVRSTSATAVNMDFRVRSGFVNVYRAEICGIKSDGSAVAVYSRRITVKNVGGTLTVVESQTIGTDYEDNASTNVAVTTNAANLRIQVTGIAGETWRWCAVLYGMDHEYGT
jgi:hypothetical protein